MTSATTERRRAPTGLLVALAVVTGCVAAGLTAVALVGEAPVDGRALPWAVVAAGYCLTELFLVHFEHRRESHSVSFSPVPLVMGLFTLSPLALVAARLVGSTSGALGRWRKAPLKAVVNLASFWLETAVAVAVFRSLVPASAGAGPRAWLPAFVAALAGDLVQAVVVTAAIAVCERRVEPINGAALIGPAVSVAGTAFALAAVVLWNAEPLALAMLGLVLPLLFLSSRVHATLREKLRNLEQLHDFTTAVGEAVVAGRLVPVVLSEVRDLMHAESSWLCVSGDHGGVVRVRAEGDEVVSVPMPAGAVDDILHRAALAAGSSLLVDAGDVDEPARVVRSAGLQQVLVAPLADVSGLPATLVVADRSGEVRSFGFDDVQLFGTLANHARASFENGQLLERLREQAAASEHQSLHDALTGLPNRVLFGARLAAALDRAASVAVLLLDLDRFKEINDTLGHHNGDHLLQEVGARLSAVVGPGDTIARLGGDEFALLLHGVSSPEEAVRAGHTVLGALDAPFDVSGVPVTVVASVGAAVAPLHGDEAAVLLQRADVAMYTAKADQSGVESYRRERDNYSPDRLALAGALRTAIEKGQLAVHYQPQVDLASETVIGVEALVRWPDGPAGVSPFELVTLAEHTGLIRGLTSFVLGEAVRAAARWHRQGMPLRVSVNVSARVLADRELAGEVRSALDAVGLPASALCLELTETSIMSDDEHTLEVLARLRDIGVTLAVDDFGMGYSSLAYLKRLPVGEIKIDKSFVMGMAAVRADDAAIVRSVVDLGRNLGLAVVAEGVETPAAAEQLRAMGCAGGQGYLYSRPLSEADLRAWLSGASVVAGPLRVLEDDFDTLASKSSSRTGARPAVANG